MLTLFTDSDCDVTPEIAKEYGFKLISMPYVIDGKEIFPYEDFDKFDDKEFYKSLRDGVLPATCAINPDKYIEYFEPEFAKGNDILYVHFSAAMSGTFNAMRLALEELKEKYPERKFYEIDTKAISALSLMIIKEIGEMFKQGKTVEEVIEWSKTGVDKFAIYFYANHLQFFKRSGRVSGFSATMGSILGIHPILTMNAEGKMVTVAKKSGKRNTLNKILDYMEQIGDDFKNHRIIVAHTDALDIANEAVDMMKARFGDDLDIEYVPVNPTAGAHCGPDTIGICFRSISR